MRRVKLCASATLAVVGLSIPRLLSAADQTTPSPGFALPKSDLNIINGVFLSGRSWPKRRDLATDLLEAVDGARLSLKELTPNEVEWVKRQDAACSTQDTDRCVRYVNSDTFSLNRLHEELDKAQSNLRCVLASPNVRDEITRWAMFSYVGGDRSFIEDVTAARAKGWFVRATHHEDATAVFLHWAAHGVLNAFVVPYLKGEIPEHQTTTLP